MAAMRDSGHRIDRQARTPGAQRAPGPLARRILDTVRTTQGDPVVTVEALAAAWRLSPRSLERRCRSYQVRAKDVVDFIRCGRALLSVEDGEWDPDALFPELDPRTAARLRRLGSLGGPRRLTLGEFILKQQFLRGCRLYDDLVALMADE
jgi:hypothetical protein